MNILHKHSALAVRCPRRKIWEEKTILGTTNMLEWVHTTYKHHNVVVYMHAQDPTLLI
jgi:hypothetical protein